MRSQVLFPVQQTDFSGQAAGYFLYRRLKGGLPIAQAVPYLLGGAAGGVLAGKLFGRVKADWLRRAFGVLILYGGIRAVLLL